MATTEPDVTAANEKPLPCPFCGTNAALDAPNYGRCQQIICMACGAEGPEIRHGCLSDAIAAWNRRAQAAEGVDEAAAALKELLDAIDARYVAETERKRANAISPRMEEAIAKARELLAGSGAVDRAKEREALFNEVVDALTDIMRQIDCVDGTAQLIVDKQDTLLAKLARARGGK